MFLITLKSYINTLKHKNKQFSIKQQVLKFYIIYTGTIFKQNSLFADKVKDQASWKLAGYIKEDLDVLKKPFHNQRAVHQKFQENSEVALATIEKK